VDSDDFNVSHAPHVLRRRARGVYRDGEGTEHASLHANLFPLAFGLVPQDKRERVTGWLRTRGMACSLGASRRALGVRTVAGCSRRTSWAPSPSKSAEPAPLKLTEKQRAIYSPTVGNPVKK
jgi:hypothetical protein